MFKCSSPHTSHLTQPLNVGMFCPLKRYCNQECQSYLQKSSGVKITRYEVIQLTAKPYIKALCTENIVSAFQKSGVFQIAANRMTPSQVVPAVIYGESNEIQPAYPKPEETQNAVKILKNFYIQIMFYQSCPKTKKRKNSLFGMLSVVACLKLIL